VKDYTVHQLADLARVSVRTLHHYDHIGLLRPSLRTEAGYRLYRRPDLLRLQQILFFKEQDLPLAEIRSILDDPSYDVVESLRQQRQLLLGKARRTEQLLRTIDQTIASMTEGHMPLTDEELYEGFTPEQAARYEREAEEMYDPDVVRESRQRVRALSKQQWDGIKLEGGEITKAIAALVDLPPEAPEVQRLIAKHHAWIEHFYPAPADLYEGLGRLYSEHEDFRTFYEQFRPGLPDFMRDAMTFYAIETLAR
jgi:DNA-binding transcriptional MerR regulator